jgi:hypothetical protein
MKPSDFVGSTLFALCGLALLGILGISLGVAPGESSLIALWAMASVTLIVGSLAFAFGSAPRTAAVALTAAGATLTVTALIATALQLAAYVGIVALASSLWPVLVMAFLAGTTLWVLGAGLRRVPG